MNRNVYDTDCVTWSPQGRIFQIEYAGEAVKQGTCVVGVCSKTHAVLCALRRSVSSLADYNAKVLKVDDHVGVTFSGITADAYLIVRGLRSDCLNHKYLYGHPAGVERLLVKLSHKSQQNTQDYDKRPFGVGLLVAGYDTTGAHLFETMPSGDFVGYHATAFGSRCQSAKTYLESQADKFQDASEAELLEIALRAIAATVAADQDLIGPSLHIGIVGKDTPWKIVPSEEIGSRLDELNLTHRAEQDVSSS